MKELEKLRIENKKQDVINILMMLCFVLLTIFFFVHNNRLNEQKRLLIAQQEQINKLILNAEYNEIKRNSKRN